jgi:hypothetical protein
MFGFGNFSLLLHNAGLTLVNLKLEPSDNDQGTTHKNFDEFSDDVATGFFTAAMAVALLGIAVGLSLLGYRSGGWLLYVMLAAGAIIAAAAPITSILVVYRISHGNWEFLFSENVSTALGIDASATCYRSAENIRVIKPRNIRRHIFGAHRVERVDIKMV